MITLILEIWLTVKAWRKGWRGAAVLPLVAILVGCFMIGAAAGATGGKIEQVAPIIILYELIWLGVLIRLAVKGPKHAMTNAETPAAHSAPAEAQADMPARDLRAAA